MKAVKKSKIHYLILFFFSLVLMGIYVILNFLEGRLAPENIWVYLLIPFVFTGIYWGGDVLMTKVRDKRKKVDYYGLFLDAVGERMRNSQEFLLEDFRRLQESERFQDAVKTAYFIYQNGEAGSIGLDRLEKKFEKRSLEHKAIQYVIGYVREQKAENANNPVKNGENQV
jgi:hypothetical protein